MSRYNASLAILVAAVLALAAIPAGAQVIPCPNSDIRLDGPFLAQYPSAVVDTSTGSLFGPFHAGYNLVTGTMVLEKPIGSGADDSYVFPRDRYSIEGLPPGTVVPLTANLDVNGFVESTGECTAPGCSGTFGARIGDPFAWYAEQSVSVGQTGRSDLVTQLQFPLSITVGEPAAIAYEIYYFVPSDGIGHGGVAHATLSFSGLPAGATLVSCNGYSSQPTPTRATSWGRLKTIYR
jgi:hypothetical protein